MFDYLIQLLDWIYKKRCYFCKKVSDNQLMCKECFDEIQLLQIKPIKQLPPYKIYSATSYTDNMQKLIRAIKYHNKKDLAIQAGIILKNFWEQVPDKEYDYEIIPMPLNIKRQNKRKYNQSEIIAKEFAKYFNYKVNNNLTRRIKNTPPLYKMNAVERAEILDGAFEFMPENYSGKPILIIDDICTTGATAKELIKELESHGVDSISVLTCCATVSKYQY